jgi:8-oxo-dGTP pyrophosphatase MutT (NUDIX family)
MNATSDERIERIAHLITGGSKFRSKRMAPTLSYGRHRGPSAWNCRAAAVLVSVFVRCDGELVLPLTLRPQNMPEHPGQICLPGGRAEPGETVTEAAIREFTEELGIRPQIRRYLGRLEPLVVYSSNHCIYPVVVEIEPPTQWQPNPDEVERVIECVLDDRFCRQSLRHRRISRPLTTQLLSTTTDYFRHENSAEFIGPEPGVEFDAPCLRVGRDDWVWGTTAILVDELIKLCLPQNELTGATAR